MLNWANYFPLKEDNLAEQNINNLKSVEIRVAKHPFHPRPKKT